MAQNKDSKKDNPATMHVDEASSNVQTDPDSIREVAHALIAVAKGASVIELRSVVVKNAPADLEERKTYRDQLKRMRDAADVALTLGNELASGV